ncbi:uncharacterized protein SPPG_01478 [Spizellomyces punctatus DAOM BR117]|uniref:Uncharacterized protein n=1 Tax=Spizellomyces punctatus (strain DAOM BR117) TaxID=645134 RepID=A0A0L0HRN3_SPIPD|nr:uncharacterized protein SPPG_01478 [Spizellomyces punctatus DAOM BR117]KND04031.1 hypothetical protein SPPG_01478 [Spizellomyces punctatus DAOM BR117]|eukprot:XP_016612070.1 hypothetical protein SPPG_01478 [Spizellomyces punctatus DAOM BR117]
MTFYNQEQSTPTTSTELAELLASMNLSTTGSPPPAPSSARRTFRRQSSGPLTPTTTAEDPAPERSRDAGSEPVEGQGITPGQRAAALFGVGGLSGQAGQRGHWTGRRGTSPATSPTKPLARPRLFQRSATTQVGRSSTMAGSSSLPCPGTPDPRRRLVRHRTDPTLTPSSRNPRPLAGTKRPCTTPPSLSPTSIRSRSGHPNRVIAHQSRRLPRAPEKRRSPALFISSLRACDHLSQRARRTASGQAHSELGMESESLPKRLRRVGLDTGFDVGLERYVQESESDSEGEEMLGRQRRQIWRGKDKRAFGRSRTVGNMDDNGAFESFFGAGGLAMDPEEPEAVATDRWVLSPVAGSPSLFSIPSFAPFPDPASPCGKQAERLQAAKTMDMLVQSMEANLKF